MTRDGESFGDQVTRTLQEVDKGGPQAAEELMLVVYTELRRLAGARLAKIGVRQTVQATDLVHEAWLRLVGKGDPGWNGRAHFFGAAAKAMRNILVEQARQKGSLKRDVARKQPLEGDEPLFVTELPVDDILTLNDALERLEEAHERKAKVVSLRYFAGLSMPEVAELLDISLATAERDWRFARAWLADQMGAGESPDGPPGDSAGDSAGDPPGDSPGE